MSLKHYEYIRGLYVIQLKDDLQAEIENKLIEYFVNELGLNQDELEVELELAMNSRVGDLEDTIFL